MSLHSPARSGRTATWFALGSAVLIIAHQVAGKATRDALFLSNYDVSVLPKVVIASAVLSMLAVIVISGLLARFGPSRVIPWSFLVSAALFVGNWWLSASSPALVALLLYVQMAVFGAVMISGFWSVVNERFDPHSAKRTIAKIAAAATLGGVLGALIAGSVSEAVDVRAMILVLSGLHLACAATTRGIGHAGRRVSRKGDTDLAAGVRILLAHPYLRSMALLMLLVAVVAALADYVLKAQVSATFTGSEEMVGFFGPFYAAIGVLTFAVQFAVGPRMLQRFGIGVTLAVLPSIVFCTGAIGVFVAKLWSMVLLRGSQMVFTNSFFRSAFELLYTPVTPARKRPTKTFIDVASDRMGDVLGSGLILAMLALMPDLSTKVVSFAVAIVSLVALLVVSRLYYGYIDQLAGSLRDETISVQGSDVVDATTRHTLAEVSGHVERELLMQRVKEMKHTRLGATVPPVPDSAPTTWTSDNPLLPREMTDAIDALCSGDTRRIRSCLAGEFMDYRLVPYVIPLLGNDAMAEDARMELRWMAPQTLGMLTDALLDPDLPVLVRQRLPSVLEVSHHPRAIEALLHGLEDEAFGVRYSCARALDRMSRRSPDLEVDPVRIYAAVLVELNVDPETWRSRELEADVDLPIDHLSANPHAARPRVEYSMEHVFTLLGLVLDRDALFLSMHAIFSEDRNLRGTALEYLENVLPEMVRLGLWPHVGEAPPHTGRRRARADLVAELRRLVKPA